MFEIRRTLWSSGVRLRFFILVAVFWIAGAHSPVLAQSEAPSEYQVKSAFLYNFAKFTEWPSSAFADAQSPLVIGVVGDDPFGRQLDEMVAGKSINGRSIEIRRLRRGSDLRQCHLLFVSASERKGLAAILAGVKSFGVLTVSDLDGFLRNGGAIELLLVDDRVRFDINLEPAHQAGLKISSKLLALARSVTDFRAAGGSGGKH
jgi:hypothetical protein